MMQRAKTESSGREDEPLELGLDAAGLGFWDWDIPTGKTYFSRQYQMMLGYQPGEVDGWQTLVHLDDAAAAARTLFEYLVGGSDKYADQYRIRKKNGEYARVLSRGLIVERDREGHPLRMIAVQEDIGQRDSLEQQLQQAQKMEGIGLLTSGIAHDFNNLLTVVNGYADLLLCHKVPPETRPEYLKMIREAGERASTLVRRLLTYVRQETQKPEIITLNAAVTEFCRLIDSLLPENIQVTTRLAPRLGTVLADAGLIQQVLMNLVVNSRDAMPDGGKIEIETTNVHLSADWAVHHPEMSPGNYVQLTVADTGVGMDEETQQRVFEPFYTTKEAGVGTGLGLSTVYNIVKQSGGSISVRSEVNKGTRMTICLPRSQGEMENSRLPAPATPDGGTETILLVEDNESVRQFTAAVLEDLGYTVVTAANGREAVKLACDVTRRLDLLLSDFVLPDTTGRDIGEALRASRPDLAVLLISGYPEDVPSPGGPRPIEFDFLQKPFTPDSLALKVQQVLRKRERQRILIVDDNAATLELCSGILTGAGFEVFAARNGRDAFTAIQENGVHLMITDLVMPEMDGLEVIGQLRKQDPSLPVIAISGAFNGQYLKTALALGAQETLHKPFSGTDLVEIVRRVFQKRVGSEPECGATLLPSA